MTDNNDIIIIGRFNCSWTPFRKAIYIIYYVIASIAFYKYGPGLNYDVVTFGEEHTGKFLWGQMYYNKGIKINKDDFLDTSAWGYDEGLNQKVLMKGLLITAVVFIFPLIINWMQKYIAYRCELKVKSGSISGYKKTFFGGSSIYIEIDRIQNIFVKTEIADYFRGSQTLHIIYDTGAVSFSFLPRNILFSLLGTLSEKRYSSDRCFTNI